MTNQDKLRDQAITIVASHDDQDPIGMLAFVKGGMEGIIAFGVMDETTKTVTSELIQQIDEYIEYYCLAEKKRV